MGLQLVVERLRAFWQGLSPAQRVMTGGLGLFAVALLVYLSIWAQTPEYAVAYRGLEDKDAADIVDALGAAGIPYQLDASGSTIRIPTPQLAQARLEVARQGLPKASSAGFDEIFGGGQLDSLGMTDAVQRVNFRRALEGELERTIGTLDAVAMARVHIVIPEPALFLEDETPPTASVLLQLQRNARVDRNTVQAITHLVASSVEGMSADHVTVVDVAGNILSTGEGDSTLLAAEATNTQMAMQRQYETDMEKRLQSLLAQVLGPGKAVAQVSATFEWDAVETTRETYEPINGENGVLRSAQSTEEQFVGDNAQAGGVPGVDNNTPGEVPTYPTVGEGTAGSYVKRTSTENWELSRTVQTTVRAPGELSRLSVAVLVDESVEPAQVVSLQAMIAAAVGFDAVRGDAVVVERLAFDTSQAQQQAQDLAAAQRQELITTVAKVVAAVVGMALVLLFVRGLFRDLSRHVLTKPVIREVGAEALASGLTPTVATLAAGDAMTPQLTPAAQAAAAYQVANELSQKAQTEGKHAFDRDFINPEELEGITLESLEARFRDEDIRRRMRRQREVILLARKNPELVAQMLQAWLSPGVGN